MPEFAHLHCHTQYSLLDGAANIDKMVQKVKQADMKAVAITDHGNMFGAFHFYRAAEKAGIKPILGCEFYVVKDRFQKKFDKQNKDKRFHQLLLAKNATGYRNLSKLCSLGFMEGLYGKFPRIDKGLLRQYKEGLIATTCCVAAEVPQTFLHQGPAAAEKVLLEYHEMFEDDYYIELQRHQLTGIDQEGVNQFLLKMAQKHQIKTIATNDSHYVNQDDYEAHDILLCVETGNFVDDTNRFKFENDQFYVKTPEEMAHTFPDVPESIENTLEIVEKIDTPDLKRDILLPNFQLPKGFQNEDDYLEHLTFEGAKKRYGSVTDEIHQRLKYELGIIKEMGFAGYFLIVQDFIKAAKQLKVMVGPGRGSAAGSAVAYCTEITNIDPIRYNLLFERFLNPERVSMPDIDIDFDDYNRQRVIDYVIDKYGKNQVAQIITFGTMAAKSAIRDVGRVTRLPLSDANRLAKMVPEGPGVTLDKSFEEIAELEEIRQGGSHEGKTLNLARKLEGSVRHRGIHAAGVIIAPDDLTDYIPVCTAKDTDLLVTQFDGKVIEDAGMLKMDFLGLKTLSIIKDAIEIIAKRHQISIDPDQIPLEDDKTFELYKAGDTVGTFQFESEGMRAYLKQLKPTNIEDLIAMNALYRPGPMDFIPDFIKRKHGEEAVHYPHPLLEKLLQPTYGIMVYQEQIMQCAQIIAGFSLGKADILRRAMGKKKMDVMQEMKVEFVKGAAEQHEIDKKKAEEIFSIMEKFAAYGFNRSHSAAYSVVAYQTAYLKANYPAEYMAAVLGHNMHDIKKVVFFIDACRKRGIKVLGPDVNESDARFTVNEKGEILFGLNAIKGVGEAAVQAIMEERVNGHYQDLFDLAKRVNLRAVNKKALESLIYTGAFDRIESGVHRSQFLESESEKEPNYLEKIVRTAQKSKAQSMTSQQSLFGEAENEALFKPEPPQIPAWEPLETLKKEKELIGFYISGHPLDDFAFEFANGLTSLKQEALEAKNQQKVHVGGIIVQVNERRDKNGRKFAIVQIEDFDDSLEFMVFSDKYLQFGNLLEEGEAIWVKGKAETKYRSDDTYTVNPDEIKYLANFREEMYEAIQLHIPLSGITANRILEMEQVLLDYPGKHLLQFDIFRPWEGKRQSLSLQSKQFKVDIQQEMCDRLTTIIPELEVEMKFVK